MISAAKNLNDWIAFIYDDWSCPSFVKEVAECKEYAKPELPAEVYTI